MATSDGEVRRKRNSVGNITAWCVWCEERVRETGMRDSFFMNVCGRGSPSLGSFGTRRARADAALSGTATRKGLKKNWVPRFARISFRAAAQTRKVLKKNLSCQRGPEASPPLHALPLGATSSGLSLHWSLKVVSARFCRRKRATAACPKKVAR